MNKFKNFFNTTRSILIIIGSILVIIGIVAIAVFVNKEKARRFWESFYGEKEKIAVNVELIKEYIGNIKKDTKKLETEEERLERELNELDKNDGSKDVPSTGDLTDEEILKAFREKQKELLK